MSGNEAVLINKDGIVDEEANNEKEAMSTDTKSFRLFMYTELQDLKKKFNGCGVSSEVARAHDNKLNMLEKRNEKLQKGQSHLVAGQIKLAGELSLIKQAVEFGNMATIKAIGDLEKGRDANAKTAEFAKEKVSKVNEKVIALSSEKRTMYMMIGVIFSVLVAVVTAGLSVWGIMVSKNDKIEIEHMQKTIMNCQNTKCPYIGILHLHELDGSVRFVK